MSNQDNAELLREVFDLRLRLKDAEQDLAAAREDSQRLDKLQAETKHRVVTVQCRPKTGLMTHDEFAVHLNGIGWAEAKDNIRAAIDAVRVKGAT